ncbi:AGL347Cp [Eremothecium gossypii ATCC 10895]|uniref:AGL347Cp n=1 Tax=Eremothecium gossypii (strain ATCC 10895 / CBS 109.51 / FGSC 9923 / NRRL Y-1056) TaxID=284811 RepID=Q751N7_EREGS|nr:AGL347Cp [Eremothecium gossypii ATCC 10895]AAS54144.1 AGL347Cp [Eremothecium gossypii ATCC 10895]AEY98470.1 FAGL347Cp [Eremothecium gossypii FDAG1]
MDGGCADGGQVKRAGRPASVGRQIAMASGTSGHVLAVSALPLDRPVFCAEDEGVLEVVRRLQAEGGHCALVGDGGRVAGIITTKDLALRGRGSARERRVRDVVTWGAVTVDEHAPVNAALELMVVRRLRHLPVLQAGSREVLGVLDITKCFQLAMAWLEWAAVGGTRLQDVLSDVACGAADGRRRALGIARVVQQMEMPTLQWLLASRRYATGLAVASPTTTVREALALMRRLDTTAVLVRDVEPLAAGAQGLPSPHVRPGRGADAYTVIGIFTSKDVVCRVLQQGLDPETDGCTLARFMTSWPQYAAETEGLHSALLMMHDGHYLNLPVVKTTGAIVGLFTVLQLTHAALSWCLEGRLQGDSLHVGGASCAVKKETGDPGAHGRLTRADQWYNLVGEHDYIYFLQSFDTSDYACSISSSSSQSPTKMQQSCLVSHRQLDTISNPELEFTNVRLSPQHTRFRRPGFCKRQRTLLQKDFFGNCASGTHTCRVAVVLADGDGSNFINSVRVLVRGNGLDSFRRLIVKIDATLKLGSAIGDSDMYHINCPDKLIKCEQDFQDILKLHFKTAGYGSDIPLILKLKRYSKPGWGLSLLNWLISRFQALRSVAESSWMKFGVFFMLGVGFGKMLL